MNNNNSIGLTNKRWRRQLCLLSLAFACQSQAQVGQLLWQENFDTLDSNVWNIDVGDGCDINLCGWGNQELQWYAQNNVSIAPVAGEAGNNALVLEARRELAGGKAFTSGKVNSKNNVSVQYGMIEVRMKSPQVGTGLWPAAWMLGTSSETWPANGEIDIMEMGHKDEERARQGHSGSDINSYVGSNLIFYASDACSSGNPNCAASTAWDTGYNKPYVANTPLSDRFVIYRTYWTDSNIRFTITDNGVEHDLYEAPFTITESASEFKAPFYLLLNLAVGGNFTDAMSNGAVNAPLPGKLYIDYVRVYQYNGQGSVTVNGGGDTQVKIQAEDYTAYFDTTAGNAGGAYRNDNVDIEATSDTDGGFNVGWTDAGEWLEYPINLAPGTYDVESRVASAVGGGSFNLTLEGQTIANDNIANTGGWQSFQTHQLGSFTTNGGPQTLRVNVTAGLFNLNWLHIKQTTVTPPPTSVTGINQVNDTSVEFYVNTSSWADVHYTINGGGQQNFRMTQSGGVNSKTVSGLTAGDVVRYWFTYKPDNEPVLSTEPQIHTMSGTNPPVDSDGDGVVDGQDQCPDTPAGSQVDANGCPVVVVTDSDGDGVEDSVDQCPDTPVGTQVDAVGCPVVVTPPDLGEIIPLFNTNTLLEQPILFDRGDAVVTRFADRARDRHAKEDQFQAYDHYLSFYWKHRTARFEIVDYVAKGGSTIEFNFVTEWKLGAREFRAWYYGMNTVAEYHGNYEHNVVEVGHGTFDDNLNQISTNGDQYKYQLVINQYRALDGSAGPLATGQEMEFEVSQFLDGVPQGRANYYGTTYLYMVGQGGVVPWYTVGDFNDKSSERENAHKIDESGWLGGGTTLPYNYTNEPNDHFMQMATNLSSLNGQPFVLGRRVHHTDFVDGQHDERVENGIFAEMVGKAGTHYINARCSGCHERNGRAAPAEVGEVLDKWVFKVGDGNGAPDPRIGRVLQGNNVGINDATDGEGSVSIASWTENNGLRSPNYAFSRNVPAQFSARIAPQLVGLGLLEAIEETSIVALEDVNDSNNDGISGKAQRVTDPVTGQTRLGRFGYKAATASLKHQIAAAFNTDMGVMTSVLPQPDCGSAQTICGHSGPELADEHLDNLVKYVALLGVRPQRGLDDPQVAQGKALFGQIGCDGCHTPTFQTSQFHPFSELRGQTIHPYSDMLLHDMGPALADSLGEGQASGSEWRTAPLWGLGLSACVTGGVINPTGGQGNEVCDAKPSYLHDGRARTIEEAILWHGGEGANARTAFENLSQANKNALMAFLNSL